MTAGERVQRRRDIFATNHVLVAKTAQAADGTGLPLLPSIFNNVAQEQDRHGSSRAQATAETPAESREEHMLRSSLQLQPAAVPLFTIYGTFAEVVKPSKSTMNALKHFERSLGISFIDWRQLLAVTKTRRLMRVTLQRRFEVSAASGSLTATAVRAFLLCVKGHLAEIDDGQEWRPMIDLCVDMINSIIKECRPLLTKAQGQWHARHVTEERLDHPTRLEIEQAVLSALEEKADAPLPEGQKER